MPGAANQIFLISSKVKLPARAAYSGLLLLLIISSCFTYTATAQRLVIKKYTVNDGLADSYILSICQDSQGFLWVGTANGLSRFDGTAFINYGYAEGLPNLVVDAIYEDHQKRLWAGTRRGIVQIKNNGCIVYPASDHQVITFVFDIKELSNHDLVACTDKGLYRFNGTEWEKEPAYPGLENHHCRNIVEHNNSLLINYGDYLVRKDKNNQFHLLDKQIKETWYNIVARYNNRLYINAFHSLYQWQSPADTIPLFQKSLNNKIVSCFFRDSRGRFWINTRQDGLLVSAPNNTNRILDTIAVAYNMICRV